jgi:hypothetical protein
MRKNGEFRSAVLALLVGANAVGISAPALAQSTTPNTQELLDRLEKQNEQIRQIQDQLKKEPSKGSVQSPSPPGTVRFGKANVSLSGSWFEGVMAYRRHNELSSASGSTVNTPFPSAATYDSTEFRTDARGTRLNLTVSSDPFGDGQQLKGRLQFDWANAANGTGQNNGNWAPRLRQAWIAWDLNQSGWHFLFGQNWSLVTPGGNLTAADGGPSADLGWSMRPGSENSLQQIDAFLPGYIGNRQPQFRIVKDLAQGAAIGLSVENPTVTWGGNTAGINGGAMSSGGSGSGSTSSTTGSNGSLANYSATGYVNTSPLSIAPAIALKGAYQPVPEVLVEAYGILRNYRDIPGPTGPASTGSISAGGAGVDTYLKIVPTKLDLALSASYGSLGGMDSSGALPDVTTDNTGNPAAVKVRAAWAGLFAYPSRNLTLLLYAGYTDAERAGVSGTTNGFGNPNYLNTGCRVRGGECKGNIASALTAQVAGVWRIVNGPQGRVELQPQVTYIEESRFMDVNGVRPYATNWVLNLGVRYFPF